jgi:hypothetical protein
MEEKKEECDGSVERTIIVGRNEQGEQSTQFNDLVRFVI